MKIKKDPNLDPTNSGSLPLPPQNTPITSPESTKITTTALGAIQPKTSSSIRTNDIIIQKIQALQSVVPQTLDLKLFIFNEAGDLDLYVGDPLLAIMMIINNQLIVHEAHQDAALANLKKNNYQIGQVDFSSVEITVIPEELWGELHVQIATLIPLLQKLAPEVSEQASATEKDVEKKEAPAVTKKISAPTIHLTHSSSKTQSMRWKEVMSMFLAETDKIIKSMKEKHEQEKMEQEKAHKADVIRKEITNYEEKRSRIQKAATKDDMIAAIKEWTEGLPPFAIGERSAITVWRNLVNKLIE